LSDIICAKCGRHFNSIEDARGHRGHCKNSPEDEAMHWSPSPKSKMAPEEWEALVDKINNQKIPEDNRNPENVNLNLTEIPCPNCRSKLYHDFKLLVWKCKHCKRVYTHGELLDHQKKAEAYTEDTIIKRNTSENTQSDNIKTDSTEDIKTKKKAHYNRTPFWLIAVLFIFSLSICGLGISLFVGILIPFWILFGFSIIFSIEKWFSYITRKYKGIGKLYRLLLNVCILSVFGLLIWSGIKLFSHQFVHSSLAGSLIFLAEFIFFIWMWRIVSKNSWRWPSMKLTIFSLICLFLVLAFAGVSPFNEYKNNLMGLFSRDSTLDNSLNNLTPSSTVTTVKPQAVTPKPISTITPTPTIKNTGIDRKTGVYQNYYLGLVKDPEGVLDGNGCYGEFIILINNKNAKNPTYAELLNFLKSDKTDEFPYQYTVSVSGFYYGAAEDKIDLNRIKDIIDGTVQPSNPKICADFAERLHNNAEKAGIRCGHVSLDMTGYTDPNNLGIKSNAGHACNVFETTDRGLVYIDCTGNIGGYGPTNNDTIVDVTAGKQYNPQFLFPSGGWSIPSGDMGAVTSIFLVWDGDWR
jgi:ribosomal protein L37AE/L43A